MANEEKQERRSPEVGLSGKLREKFRLAGRNRSLEIDFREQESPTMLLSRIKRTGDFWFLESDRYETRLAMIVGGRGEGVAWGGGYILECFEKGKTAPVCVVLGHERDQQTNGMGQAGMRPVFLADQGGEKYVISFGCPEFFGPAFDSEAVAAQADVVNKIEAVIDFIGSHINDGGRPQASLVAPAVVYRPRPARLVALSGGRLRGEVRNLSEEIAQALIGEEKRPVRIDNLPESLDAKVKSLLEDGLAEFGKLGIINDGFRFGQTYEDEKTGGEICWAAAGSREQGQLVIQVREDNKKKGTRSLSIGCVRDLPGENRDLTGSIILDYGYAGTTVGPISLLELRVHDVLNWRISFGATYSEKTGELRRWVPGERSARAETVYRNIFEGRSQRFRGALAALLG